MKTYSFKDYFTFIIQIFFFASYYYIYQFISNQKPDFLFEVLKGFVITIIIVIIGTFQLLLMKHFFTLLSNDAFYQQKKQILRQELNLEQEKLKYHKLYKQQLLNESDEIRQIQNKNMKNNKNE